VSLVALVGIFFLVLSKPNHHLCRLTFSDREGVFQTKLIGSRCGLPGGRYRYNYRIGWHPFIPSGLDASFNFHEIIPIRPSTASAIFRLRFHYRLLHRFLHSSVRLLVCLRLCGLEPIERGTNCRPPNRFLRVHRRRNAAAEASSSAAAPAFVRRKCVGALSPSPRQQDVNFNCYRRIRSGRRAFPAIFVRLPRRSSGTSSPWPQP
jgi:hypothetical protein